MLRRNLLYTAVTRAKRIVALVGSTCALATAVRTEGVGQRYACPGYFIHPSRFGWFRPRADKHDAARQGWERQPRHSFPSHIVGQARVAPGWLG